MFFVSAAMAAEERLPNIVLIMVDDMGYSDIGCQGSVGYQTPNIDRMGKEGTRFTSFYVAQAVCTASRAALLSGSYPNRVSMQGALNHTSREGIHPDELLISEMCKAKGYATGMYGKWHLGTVDAFHPLKNGFDDYLGIPYSNDNSKYHPVLADEMPPLPLYDGEKIVELDADQHLFTKRFTERSVAFIEKHKDEPFLLYVPHVMPHVPIFASEGFEGTTEAGLWGDVISELDWSVGEILNALQDNDLDQDTLVVFFSDNGPFLSYGTHAGHAVPLREGKLTSFEGGVRVPCIMRWPGRIPAGRVCDEPLIEMDFLPTIAGLLGADLPERKIDGVDILPVMENRPDAGSPHEALFFWSGSELQAVRSGPWKLHFAHKYITVAAEPGKDGKPSNWENMQPKSITQSGVEGIASRHGYRVEELELSLYNLDTDMGETKNVAGAHPEVVERLSKLAEPMRAALGDSLQNVIGSEARERGFLPE